MNRLLAVTGTRLSRDKVFYAGALITLAIALAISITNAPTVFEWKQAGEDCGLESFFFNFAPLLGLVFASFVSLFVGVEYSDGTLRNKLIAGHSRTSVFISLFTVSFGGCLLITAAWLIGSLPGFYWFHGFDFGWTTFGFYVLTLVATAMSFSAIFTTLAMLVPNKALSAVISLVLWFVMLFAGSIIVNRLQAPEMIYDYVQQGDQWVQGNLIKNPDYLEKPLRTVFEVLSHTIPVCPAIKMSNGEVGKSLLDIAGSFGVTVVTLFAGCSVFRRKDLK